MPNTAIRVSLKQTERMGLAAYERTVQSVVTLAALTAWLGRPDQRLVLRGRATDPVRLETLTYGSTFEMLVVLGPSTPTSDKAAAAIAALVENAAAAPASATTGVAGEIDLLDRSAPRGRSVVERALRTMLEEARADVLERRMSSKVRAASALVRLVEDGAVIAVERVADAQAETLETEVVDDVLEPGDVAVVPETPDEAAIVADAPVVTAESPTLVTPSAPPLPSSTPEVAAARAKKAKTKERDAAAVLASAEKTAAKRAKADQAKANDRAARTILAEAKATADDAKRALKSLADDASKAQRKRAERTADEAKDLKKRAKKVAEHAADKLEAAAKQAKKAKKAQQERSH